MLTDRDKTFCFQKLIRSRQRRFPFSSSWRELKQLFLCVTICVAVDTARAQLPDLAPVSVSWSNQPVAGQSLTLYMTVTNTGSGSASGQWYEEWVVSSNQTPAGIVVGGRFHQQYSHGTVPADGSYSARFDNALLPPVPGDYYLIGVADEFGDVAETTKTNNSLSMPITLSIPDLAPVTVSWSNQPVAGQTLTLYMTVTNIGSGFASGYWYDEWVISSNQTLAGMVTGGRFHQQNGHGTVPANGSYSVRFDNAPLPPVPGDYYLIGVADEFGDVAETIKTNNSRPMPITLSIPELAPVSVTWIGKPVAGQSLTLYMTVTNTGSGFASGYWYDEWVISSNQTPAGMVTGGHFHSQYNHGTVPTNGSYTVSLNTTLPSLVAGNYYLVGVADEFGDVAESVKTNNALPIAISIGTIDLIATNLNLGGAAIAGMNLSASFTVINVGSNDYSGYWYDGVALSTNASLSGVIAAADSYNYHTLSTGDSYVHNQTIQLPPVPAGTNYYLIAQTDDRDYVPESDDLTNNLIFTRITITNVPPVVALTLSVDQTNRDSCVTVPLQLAAQIQPGSYTITNVFFYDGNTNNVIGSTGNAPYQTRSSPLHLGIHVIGAQAIDNFGLVGTATNLTTVAIHYPTNLHLLRGDLATNGDFVGCMCAYAGSNYLVETTTNLSDIASWSPYTTNQTVTNALAFTNHPSLSRRFFRTRLLP